MTGNNGFLMSNKFGLSKFKFGAFLVLSTCGSFGVGGAEKNNAFHRTEEEILFIPLIIHIVYSKSEENLSADQVLSQVSALNRDFRLQNSDRHLIDETFIGLESDVGIEFFLADTMLNEAHPGIQRIFTTTSSFAGDHIFTENSGGADPIKPDQYLNIWVGDLGGEFLGFHAIQGVAIDYRFFGTVGAIVSPYDKGRTLTHELGHFFSLDHLWGNGGCESDDGIEDTPNQESAVASCDQFWSSCGSRDMTQNFMNLAEDACLLFFTKGQRDKMRHFIAENKAELIRKEGIVLTVPHFPLESQMTVSPNPIEGRLLRVSNIPAYGSTILITSLEGKFLREALVKPGMPHEIVDLSDFHPGVYQLCVAGFRERTTIKIILR